MSAGGYVATTGGTIIDQPASRIWALLACKGIHPSAVLALGLGLISRYDLDDATLRASRPLAR